MEIIFVMIPLGLALMGVAIWAFFWAVGNGQFDDLEGPAYSVLLDDDDQPKQKDERAEQKPRND
ncbi:MAG: cbb3-type cytochrome oxidase assembly protein CcoS [Xanthomonadaceae bacterium]|nr:cbb3-type cytochrome oxidase assembly protein CcoS [Xanthomonadaceae bacterium]